MDGIGARVLTVSACFAALLDAMGDFVANQETEDSSTQSRSRSSG